MCLEGLAIVASSQDEPERAARLFGAAESRPRSLGTSIWPADRAECESHREAVRAALGKDRADAMGEEGHRMPLEQITAPLPPVQEKPPASETWGKRKDHRM